MSTIIINRTPATFQNPDETKTIVWRPGAKVYGVRKRCRKSELHVTEKKELGEFPTLEEAESKSRELVREWIKANMKTVDRAFVSIQLWRIDESSGFEEWRPFSKDENLVFPLST